MRSRCLATAILCGCLLGLPAFAADKKAPADASKDVDGDKVPTGEYAGKLTTAPGSDGSFTLRVEIDREEMNPNAARNEARQVQQTTRDEQQIARLEADVASARNPNEYRQRVQKLAEELQRLQTQALQQQLKPNANVKIVKDYKEVDFHAVDDVKVRILTPPNQFDDKGNPKVYTKAELKEMKGKDVDLPGYEAALTSLKAGDTVKVTLAHPKPAKKDADKDPDAKESDAKTGKVVTLIVIVSEATDAGDGKKKK